MSKLLKKTVQKRTLVKEKSGLTSSDWKKLDTRFEKIESQLDRIVLKLVDHEDLLVNIEENMVTKQEFGIEMDKIYTIFDRQQKILERLDHEYAAVRVTLVRHEELLSA